MTQVNVKLLVPFGSLIDSLRELSPGEKHQLWKWLNEHLAQLEIRETPTDYLVRDDLTTKEHPQLEIINSSKILHLRND